MSYQLIDILEDGLDDIRECHSLGLNMDKVANGFTPSKHGCWDCYKIFYKDGSEGYLNINNRTNEWEVIEK